MRLNGIGAGAEIHPGRRTRAGNSRVLLEALAQAAARYFRLKDGSFLDLSDDGRVAAAGGFHLRGGAGGGCGVGRDGGRHHPPAGRTARAICNSLLESLAICRWRWSAACRTTVAAADRPRQGAGRASCRRRLEPAPVSGARLSSGCWRWIGCTWAVCWRTTWAWAKPCR